MKYGVVCLERLLYRRGYNLLLALLLYLLALAMLREQRVYLRDTHFGGLFQEPFKTINILCRCYGHNQIICQWLVVWRCLYDLYCTTFWVVTHHFTAIHITFAVGDVQLVATLHSKYADAVFRLLLAKSIARK